MIFLISAALAADSADERIEALEARVADLEIQLGGLLPLPPPTISPIEWSDAKFVAISASGITPNYDTNDVRVALEEDVEGELKRCLSESGVKYISIRGSFLISRLNLRVTSLAVPLTLLGDEGVWLDACLTSAFERFQMVWNSDLSPNRTAVVSFIFEAPSGFVSP